MQNIHVIRYQTPQQIGYQGCVEPDDRSWLVFIDSNGDASFWRRCEYEEDDHSVHHGYIDAELPFGLQPKEEIASELAEKLPLRTEEGNTDGLSYKVVPVDEVTEKQWNDLSAHEEPKPKRGFFALLGERTIACWGETEHEAVTSLLNHVAQMCVAGCLDHTGRAMPGGNLRRYQAIFPKDSPS